MRIVIVGNKIERGEDRVVSKEVAEGYAEKKKADLYFEVSARTGEGIVELFKKVGAFGPIPARQKSSVEQIRRYPLTGLSGNNNSNKRACC
jgi:selenocysteine-specific translation elongation factor